MEREIFFTGIGGQGVQLAARVLALAGMREGRRVMSLGTYGGSMRGGNTDSTVVIADGPIEAPPIVSRGWAALVAHPRYWAPVQRKLRAGGLVVYDAGLAEAPLHAEGVRSCPVDAGAIAREVDAPLAGSLVLLGTLCGATDLVSLSSLEGAMAEALPPYRRQHADANARALATGYAAGTDHGAEAGNTARRAEVLLAWPAAAEARG